MTWVRRTGHASTSSRSLPSVGFCPAVRLLVYTVVFECIFNVHACVVRSVREDVVSELAISFRRWAYHLQYWQQHFQFSRAAAAANSRQQVGHHVCFKGGKALFFSPLPVWVAVPRCDRKMYGRKKKESNLLKIWTV